MVLFVLWRDAKVEPYSVEDGEPVGPDTERLAEAIVGLLMERPCPTVDEPDAERRPASEGGARSPFAEPTESLPYADAFFLEGTGAALVVDARLLRPELMTLPGRDLVPWTRSVPMASSSLQVCRIRSRSGIARGSSETGAYAVSMRATSPLVNASRAVSWSSGVREVSDRWEEDNIPRGGEG